MKQVYDSYIKEKEYLLSYIYELVEYVAKIENINVEKVLSESKGPAFEEQKQHKINTDLDLYHIKNRIILIVSSLN